MNIIRSGIYEKFKKTAAIIMLPVFFICCGCVMVQVITDKSQWDIQPQFQEAHDFSEGFALVKKHGRNCFINKEGKIVINSSYNIAGSFHNGLAVVSHYVKVSKNNTVLKYGYINTKGECVILPQFLEAHDFSEGLARVKIADARIKRQVVIYNNKGKPSKKPEPLDRWCYIDRNGKIIIETMFSEAGDFHDGLAVVGKKYNIAGDKVSSIDDLYGYIDQHGNVAIEPMFGYAGHFHEGLASVSKDTGYNKKFSYINKKGKFAIDTFYDEAGDFIEGVSIVKIKHTCYYIDKSGSILSENPTDFSGCEIRNFHDGLAVKIIPGKHGGHGYDIYEGVVETGSLSKIGYINKQNKPAIGKQFAAASDFSEGMARVIEINGKQGFIDKKGKMVIELQFPGDVKPEGGFTGTVHKQGKLYFTDAKSKLILKKMMENTGDFHEGFAKVRLNNQWGYIKKPAN